VAEAVAERRHRHVLSDAFMACVCVRVRGSLSPNTELVLRRGELEEKDMAKSGKASGGRESASQCPLLYTTSSARGA